MQSRGPLDLTSKIASDWRKSEYYENAEQSDWMAPFWGKNSIFKKRFFKELDISSIFLMMPWFILISLMSLPV